MVIVTKSLILLCMYCIINKNKIKYVIGIDGQASINNSEFKKIILYMEDFYYVRKSCY